MVSNKKPFRISPKGNGTYDFAYVDNNLFHEPGAVLEIEKSAQIPPHRGGYTDEEEIAAFLKYNCRRFSLSQIPDSDGRINPQAEGLVKKLMDEIKTDEDGIISTNIGLVYNFFRKFKSPMIDRDELESGGYCALLRATRNFDISKGYRFSTYACTSIIKAFTKVVANTAERGRRFPNLIRLGAENPQLDNLDEAEYLSAIRDSEMDSSNLSKIIKSALDTRNEEFIAKRFPLNEIKPLNLKEMGVLLGINKAEVAQIEKGILKTLRKAIEPELV